MSRIFEFGGLKMLLPTDGDTNTGDNNLTSVYIAQGGVSPAIGALEYCLRAIAASLPDATDPDTGISGATIDYKVKISENDVNPDYTVYKIVPVTNSPLTATLTSPGGNEKLELDIDLENVGTGSEILKDKINSAKFRSIISGTGITVTQKSDEIEISVNTSELSLTTSWQNAVKDFTDTLPGSPIEGDRYILNSNQYIYEYKDTGTGLEWVETIPQNGYAVWVNDDDASSDQGYYSFNDT
jgi:hypothetical protein